MYADNASGLHAKNRPGYQKMLKDCRKGKIDLILVKSLSRFGRDAKETMTTIRRLKRNRQISLRIKRPPSQCLCIEMAACSSIMI